MDSKLLKHFSSFMPISEEEVEALDETMTVQNFKKGTVLLNEGQISSNVYGIVRLYYAVDGEEKTSDFFIEGQWVVSTTSFDPNTPSNHILECCTDCKLVVGNSQMGEPLFKKFPNLETVCRKVMELVFFEQQGKLKTYALDSPQVRYMKLIKSRPELFQRIPQYQIASYIGVTPESLSRIRKRISENPNS